MRLRSSATAFPTACSTSFPTTFRTPFSIALSTAAFLMASRVSNIFLPQSNSAASGTTNAQYSRVAAVSKLWYAQEPDSDQTCRIAALAHPTTANPTA